MIRLFFLISVLLSSMYLHSCKAQNQSPKAKDLIYELSNYNSSTAYLLKIKGSNVEAVDTAKAQNSKFVFKNIDQYPVGMYRIYISDTVYTEVILNNERVHLKTSAKNLLDSMQVIESEENKILFDYWKYALEIRNQLQVLRMKKSIEYQKADKMDQNEINRLDIQINNLNKKIDNYSLNVKKEHPDKFAPVLLRAYQMPSYQKHIEKEGSDALPNEKVFYLIHFFDNIDFSDPRLINTKVFFVSIKDYMATFASTPTTQIYNDISDRLLEKASANKEVYKYIANMLIGNFEYGPWEKVLLHLLEKTYESDFYSKEEKKIIKAKIDIKKNLQYGKIAPDLRLTSIEGDKINLHKLDAKLKLVLFWSSECDNCEEVLPGILDAYQSYKERGFTVYAVGIESDKDIWKKKIDEYGLNWINVSDLMNTASPVIETWDVWRTPLMYLLDSENKIIAKPKTSDELFLRILESKI